MRQWLLVVMMALSSLLYAAEEISLLDSPEKDLIAAIDDDLILNADVFTVDDLGPGDENYIDQHVLRDFIESKGLIECRQKSGLLTIAGDARARWSTTAERVDGIVKRGFKTKNPVNVFKSEVNLFFDYVAATTWASTKLRWANLDGRDGGTPTKVEMDRAFIGYDIYDNDDVDFYIELGRSRLDFMFESRVEFTSIFDGIHLYYTRCFPNVCTLIVHGGPFLSDSLTNHFPWVAELFLKEIGGTDWSVKYSIIDWHRSAPTRRFGGFKDMDKLPTLENNPRYRFTISQLIFGYQTKINFLKCKTFYGYAAVLANTAAQKNFTTNDRYLNKAWYLGFTMGKLCKACDWSLDVNYQNVQAQAVPEFDMSGIGHGNIEGAFFSDAIIAGFAPTAARGFTNYRGWSATLLFAMTDSLSLRTVAQEAWPCNRSIGGDFHYASFEMSAIYAW